MYSQERKKSEVLSFIKGVIADECNNEFMKSTKISRNSYNFIFSLEGQKYKILYNRNEGNVTGDYEVLHKNLGSLAQKKNISSLSELKRDEEDKGRNPLKIQNDQTEIIEKEGDSSDLAEYELADQLEVVYNTGNQADYYDLDPELLVGYELLKDDSKHFSYEKEGLDERNNVQLNSSFKHSSDLGMDDAELVNLDKSSKIKVNNDNVLHDDALSVQSSKRFSKLSLNRNIPNLNDVVQLLKQMRDYVVVYGNLSAIFLTVGASAAMVTMPMQSSLGFVAAIILQIIKYINSMSLDDQLLSFKVDMQYDTDRIDRYFDPDDPRGPPINHFTELIESQKQAQQKLDTIRF